MDEEDGILMMGDGDGEDDTAVEAAAEGEGVTSVAWISFQDASRSCCDEKCLALTALENGSKTHGAAPGFRRGVEAEEMIFSTAPAVAADVAGSALLPKLWLSSSIERLDRLPLVTK